VHSSQGAGTVELFRREAGRVAAVLLDFTMPVMNGEDALEEMQKIRPGVRVLLSSGFNKPPRWRAPSKRCWTSRGPHPARKPSRL
jgi:DNA-binding NtrC family response regulator